MCLFNFIQVPRESLGQTIQWDHSDCAGLVEAALLYRPGWNDVQTHPQLYAELETAHFGAPFPGLGFAARGSAFL